MHCFCIYRGDALLEAVVLSRSVEYEVISSVCPLLSWVSLWLFSLLLVGLLWSSLVCLCYLFWFSYQYLPDGGLERIL